MGGWCRGLRGRSNRPVRDRRPVVAAADHGPPKRLSRDSGGRPRCPHGNQFRPRRSEEKEPQRQRPYVAARRIRGTADVQGRQLQAVSVPGSPRPNRYGPHCRPPQRERPMVRRVMGLGRVWKKLAWLLHFSRANVVRPLHRADEDAAISDLSRARGFANRLKGGFDQLVGDNSFNLHFWQQRHFIFAASIYRCMSLLPAVAPYFRYRHTGNLNPCEGLFQIVDLVRANNGLDQFHASSDRRAWAGVFFPVAESIWLLASPCT